MKEITLRHVGNKLRRRAYMFTCSYKTAWENWMEKKHTEKFSFEEVVEHLEKGRGENDEP